MTPKQQRIPRLEQWLDQQPQHRLLQINDFQFRTCEGLWELLQLDQAPEHCRIVRTNHQWLIEDTHPNMAFVILLLQDPVWVTMRDLAGVAETQHEICAQKVDLL